jgi:predicted secreted protein
MATYFGSDGSCKVVTSGGTPAALGELLSWSLTMTSDTVDSTTMGDTNRTYLAGLATGTASLSLFWDPDDAAQSDLVQRDTVDAEFYGEGADSGDTKYSGSFIVTSVARGSTHDGIATLEVEMQPSGALTIGTV